MAGPSARAWQDAVSALPPWFVTAWVAAFGLVLGSFLNVVIHRVPRRRSVIWPRSSCPSCGHLIPWHENIPLISYLLLRGRCAGCGTRISPRYPAVEGLFATLLVAAHWRFGLTAAFPIAALMLFLLSALVFTDLDCFLLPDALTLPGTYAALALSFVSPLVAPADALLGVLVAILVVEGLNLAFKLVRGLDGLGAGDTKMLMMVGAFLGWRLALLTMMIASILGAAVGIAALAWRRIRRADPEPEPEASPEATADAEEPVDPSARAPRRSVLLDLVPREPEELLMPLLYLALAVSFFMESAPDRPWWAAPHGLATPERALAGLVLGLACMLLHDRVRGRRSISDASATELWPLAGSLAGVPCSLQSAGLAAAVTAAAFLLRRPVASALVALVPRAPAAPPATTSAGDEASEPHDEDVPEGAMPLGVFLGVAAGVALFAGDTLIRWYTDSVLGLAP